MPTQLSRARSSTPAERASVSNWRRWLLALGAALVVLLFMGVSALQAPRPGATTEPPLARTLARLDPTAAVEGRPPAVVGYVPYWEQAAALDDVRRIEDLLTTVAPWWYAPTADGAVVEQHPRYTNTGDGVVRRLRAAGLRVMPTIANHRNGEWDFDVVPYIIADEATRAAHVEHLLSLVIARNYDGIVIDYELLGADDRDAFTAFVTALGTALHDHGRRLAVALHAQASDMGSGGHNVAQDYRAIGRVADEVHLMTYDLHWDESAPGPIAPLPWVVGVLDYATARIPADKLLLGIGLFGYDWGSGPVADDLQLGQVADLITRYDGTRGWDDQASSPWFAYRDGDDERIIWYEDADSVAAKLALVDRYGLGGAFVWRLGNVPDDVWHAVRQTLRPD